MEELKYVESIIFKKCEGGYVGDNGDIITEEAIKQQLEDCNYELPGGIKLFYDADNNICCRFNIV